MLLIFKNIPLKSKEKTYMKSEPIWNLNRVGGWKLYESLTNKNRKFKEIIKDMSDPDMVNDEISKEIKQIKFKSFGKVRPSKKHKKDTEIKQLEDEKENIISRQDIGEDEKETKLQQLNNKLVESLKVSQKQEMSREMEKFQS